MTKQIYNVMYLLIKIYMCLHKDFIGLDYAFILANTNISFEHVVCS